MSADDPTTRLAAVRRRLLDRAARSVELHRDYRTVRRAQQQWTTLFAGCRRALLAETPVARVALYSLDAGVALPWQDDATAQEILVVAGCVEARAAAAARQRLVPYGYVLRGAGTAGSIVASDGPATLYVRQMTAEPTTLPEPEGQWWRVPRSDFECVPPGLRRWRANAPGVEVLPLWGTRDVTSMLVRFAPGAGVRDHHHAVNEDCLMLEGEMFLGDVLLRPLDYQLAPAGGGHFGEMSDVGGTFFFHGAVDPVLLKPRDPDAD